MDWFSKNRIISVVVDNDSWILPYAEELVRKITDLGDKAVLCRTHDKIVDGLVAFYLGCVNITPRSVLDKNTYNLVVHESDLPKGRGFAPLAWQILEGKNTIPVCLIEAVDEVDSGMMFLRKELVFDGHELNNELREAQGNITVEICLDFIKADVIPKGIHQQGKPTYYKRRNPSDSALDINKTIEEQFNNLRVVDNDRYPAYFKKDGYQYRVVIEKIDE